MKFKIFLTAIIITASVFSVNKLLATTETKTMVQMNGGSLNDGQVAKVVESNSEQEIELARLAMQRSKNSKVRNFAQDMIDEHYGNNLNSKSIGRRYKLSSLESVHSDKIKKGQEKHLAHLSKLNGKKFDLAYIKNQIKIHEKALIDMDSTLLPSVQNEELKSLLIDIKPKVSLHLEQARRIIKSI